LGGAWLVERRVESGSCQRRMCWLSIQIFSCLFALVRINAMEQGVFMMSGKCRRNVMSTLTRELPNRHAHYSSPRPLPSPTPHPNALSLSCIILACCISRTSPAHHNVAGSALMHNLPACQPNERDSDKRSEREKERAKKRKRESGGKDMSELKSLGKSETHRKRKSL